jgi:hypothetical protein
MVPFRATQYKSVCQIVLALLALSISSISAQEDQEAKQRLEFMQAAVELLEPESSELKSKVALSFASKPLLRYSDPTRGGADRDEAFLLDAGVWRMGTEGRPTALITIEMYQSADKSQMLSYEFLSLSNAKFTLKHKKEDVRWEPSASGLNLKELPDAPKPADTATARLAQMRQQSRRFAAKEILNKETVECRLIAQPIDRYQSEMEKIVDGAIFTLANGTNPEIGILFESNGEIWRYGILRLSSAQASVSLDGREIIAYEKYEPRGHPSAPYHYAFYKIRMGK